MVTNIITKIKKTNVYQGIQNTNQTYRNTFKKKKREQLIHKNTNKDTDKHLLCLKRSCTSISPRHFSIQENVWVAVSILPLNTSNSCIVVNTSSFQGTYSKPLTFIIKKKIKEMKSKFLYSGLEICSVVWLTQKKYNVVQFYDRQAQGYSDERTNNHAGKRNFLLKPC